MSEVGQKIIAKVKEKAAATPDFVYEPPRPDAAFGKGTCVNVLDGKGSCIIGQALFDLGLIDASLEADEEHNGSDAGRLIEHLGLAVDRGEVTWLKDVQFWQDRQDTWAFAVQHANEKYGVSADV